MTLLTDISFTVTKLFYKCKELKWVNILLYNSIFNRPNKRVKLNNVDNGFPYVNKYRKYIDEYIIIVIMCLLEYKLYILYIYLVFIYIIYI